MTQPLATETSVIFGAARKLRDPVEGDVGYALGLHLEAGELSHVRELIGAQWLARLRDIVPTQADAFAGCGIANYHTLAPMVEHSQLWPKAARILPADAVADIRRMAWMRQLEQAWGAFSISDEENVGHEEIYWRLVRPDEPSDVGPLHADCWFWELGHGRTPPHTQRVKVWIGIHCEPGRNGLQVVPGSHRRSWRYHGVERHGSVKPQIDEDVSRLNPELVPISPGEAIVFHDRLLHGGAVNHGLQTRVSVEFTMLVSSDSTI